MQTLKPGEIVGGRYRVLEALGEGGMGTTFAAEDTETGDRVALKALSMRSLGDWKILELFEREARVLESIDHPGVPAYIDYLSADDGDAFVLVQELVEGRSLAERVAEGWRPDEEEVRRIAREVLETLAYLHGRNPPIVHRDIKPQNVMLRDDGRVALVDFGAVKDRARAEGSFASTVVGTYGYMAPEQFRGQAAPSSDLYALGATLITLLTHRSPEELPQKRLKIDFRAESGASEGFEDWLDHMIEPAPEDRLASAREALAALEGAGRERAPAPPDAATRDVPLPPWAAPDEGGARVLQRGIPEGSRLTESEVGDRLTIVLPAAGLRGFGVGNVFATGFAFFWLAFVAFWTVGAAFAGGPFALFSIPFWLVGFGLLYNTLKKLAGGETITIDRDGVSITRRLLGVQTSRVERSLDSVGEVAVKLTDLRVRPHSGHNLDAMCTRVELGVDSHDIGAHLSKAENRWLAERVRQHVARLQATSGGRFTLPEREEAVAAREEARASARARR